MQLVEAQGACSLGLKVHDGAFRVFGQLMAAGAPELQKTSTTTCFLQVFLSASEPYGLG